MRLDQLPLCRPSHIVTIDWDALETGVARRLRELGFDQGVAVELLHRGPLGRDPLACRIGRMTIALRTRQAAAVTVESRDAA